MYFSTDKQTLEDLNIFGRAGGDSVYGIFNRTFTRGGAALLEEIFMQPLSDPGQIKNRSGLIRHFADSGMVFPFKPELFDAAEVYLANTDERTMLSTEDMTLGRKLGSLIAEDPMYKTVQKGIASLLELLQGVDKFVTSPYDIEGEQIQRLLADADLAALLQVSAVKLSHHRLVELDRLLRFRHRNMVKKILSYIYHLDVYMSVAKVAVERGLIFPVLLPAGELTIRMEAVYHPLLKNPVPNSVILSRERNVIFLTGANMAGKSTFMKTLGIALYLAHVGFPVAAGKMEFSVLDGIYTTINLADDLTAGASHFYAEVLRIKKIAKEIGSSRNLLVIFDELFRGTNVKDAADATIAITSAVARKRNCLFVVSTHIMEAGEVLREQDPHISFVYLPTLMDGNKPVYTYTLREGITADRHGMVILNNEGVLDILKRGAAAIEQKPIGS